MSFRITPRALSQLLAECGYKVTERRLTDWRAKGWLPKLTRIEPPRGHGRGAYYVWCDREVVVQAFSLVASLSLRGRLETAGVLTWFAGVEYPVGQLRTMWAAFEETPWQNTLRQAVEGSPFNIDDAVEVLLGDARATRAARKVSDDFVRTQTRLVFDPGFNPETELSLKQAQHIREDLPRLVRTPGAKELLSPISAGQIKGVIVFMQDYLSRPKLAELVNSLSDEQLRAVHDDCQAVMAPYRAWMDDAIGKANDPPRRGVSSLWLGPRLAWQAGRSFMLVDIALRRMGFGKQIVATLHYLTEMMAKRETRVLLGQLKHDYEEFVATSDGDRAKVRDALARRAKTDNTYERISTIGDSAVSAITAIWRPVAREIVDALSNPTPTDTTRRIEGGFGAN